MAAVYVALVGVVVVAHAAYLAVLAFGGLAARRWRRLLPVHLAAVAWGTGAVVFRYGCPLTELELQLRERAGMGAYESGFIRRYLRDVVFPEALTPLVVAVIVALVLGGWIRLAARGAARTPAWAPRSPTRTAARSAASSRSRTSGTRSLPRA